MLMYLGYTFCNLKMVFWFLNMFFHFESFSINFFQYFKIMKNLSPNRGEEYDNLINNFDVVRLELRVFRYMRNVYEKSAYSLLYFNLL